MNSTNSQVQSTPPERSSYKVIYNPKAGEKRKKAGAGKPLSLGEVQEFFAQYNIDAEFFPTQDKGHATELAKNALAEGYGTVVGLGGDGTIGEIAQGLVGTDVRLGVLPSGTYMNIARMLGIPHDLEKAIMLLKLGRTRKIDIGAVTKLNGAPLEEPIYFIESVALGIDAQFHEQVVRFENGDKKVLLSMFKTLLEYTAHKTKITVDTAELLTRAITIQISNGPYTGAALKLAPEAKLNDHKLTVTVNNMGLIRYMLYILNLMGGKQAYEDRLLTLQGDKVELSTIYSRLVHIDGRHFGITPMECEVKPQALSVISGFSKPSESSFQENKNIYV